MSGSSNTGFSAEERAAMKERARELKAEAKLDAKKADGAKEVAATIAKMPDDDRIIAERVNSIVTKVAPDLIPKLWYGQPAWTKDGNVICFFQSSSKFKTRYCTLGFQEFAALDDGTMWPTSFALAGVSDDDAKVIAALVEKANG